MEWNGWLAALGSDCVAITAAECTMLLSTDAHHDRVDRVIPEISDMPNVLAVASLKLKIGHIGISTMIPEAQDGNTGPHPT